MSDEQQTPLHYPSTQLAASTPNRPATSHSNHLPEPAPVDSGLHVTEHERALPARQRSRAGTGAIAYKGPARAIFDRFYDRRRGHPDVGTAVGDGEGKLEPDVTYPGKRASHGLEGRERMRRSRKWILGCVVVVVILAVALGVGLGVGLKRNHHQRPPSILPHCPQKNNTLLHSNNQSFLQLCATDFKANSPAEPSNNRHADIRLARQATSPGAPPANPSAVQDLPSGPEGDANHTSGLVRYTFQACVDACAEWNVRNGYAIGKRAVLEIRQTGQRSPSSASGSGAPRTTRSTTAGAGPASSPSASGAAASASARPITSVQCKGVTYIGNVTFINMGTANGGGQNRNCYLKNAIPVGGGEVGTLGNDSASALLVG